MGKNFLVRFFSSFKLSGTVDGSFGKPAIKFFAKFLKKVFAYSPKVKEEMKVSKSVFLP